jgi:hypothetical protein
LLRYILSAKADRKKAAQGRRGRGKGDMTSGQQDEAFFRERGFGLKIGFGARPD